MAMRGTRDPLGSAEHKPTKPGDASGVGDARNPAMAQRTGFSGQEDAAPFLIQIWQDRRELLRDALVVVDAM